MPTPTDRLGLDDYDPGETGWDHSDLVALVDELIEDRDTFANRPDTGTYDGEKFYATDRRIVYEWDADAGTWEGVMGVGTSDNPLPGTAHREAIATEDINSRVDPTKFDADVGVGIDEATKDWPEHQQGAGGRVMLPRGVHTTSVGAPLYDGVVIDGCSIRSSTITASGMTAGDPLLKYETTDPATTDKYFAGFQNLRLDGDGEDVLGFYAVGNDPDNLTPNDLHAEDIIFRDTGREGVLIEGGAGWGYRFSDVLVEGCGQSSSGNGAMYVRKAELYVDRAFIAYNTADHGLKSVGGDKFFDDLSVYYNDNHGAVFSQGPVQIHGLRAIGNGQSAANAYKQIRLLSGSDGTVITNARVDGESQSLTGFEVVSNENLIGPFVAVNHGNVDVDLQGNDNILWGWYGSLNDAGDRNIVNGKSHTSGASPGSGSSVWDGHESRAHKLNALVEDRSVSAPYPQYRADSAGNWVQVG